MGTVDGGLIHLKQSGRPQLGQEDLVQTRPDTRLGPVAKASPAGHPAAADPLSRNIRPGHALAQDIDDAPQSGTVIRGQPSRIPTATRRARGKQRSNAFPQIIRHKINRHSKTLPPSSPTAKPPTPTHSETISKPDLLETPEKDPTVIVLPGLSTALKGTAGNAPRFHDDLPETRMPCGVYYSCGKHHSCPLLPS
jgi:hypothetical protein